MNIRNDNKSANILNLLETRLSLSLCVYLSLSHLLRRVCSTTETDLFEIQYRRYIPLAIYAPAKVLHQYAEIARRDKFTVEAITSRPMLSRKVSALPIASFLTSPDPRRRFYVYTFVYPVYAWRCTAIAESIRARERRHIRRICASPFTFFRGFPLWHPRRPVRAGRCLWFLTCRHMTLLLSPFCGSLDTLHSVPNVVSTVQNRTKVAL